MFQIVDQIIADVTFASGDRFEYRITQPQLDDAEAKLANGAGILRWQPDFGGRNDPLETLAVKHIARLRHFVRADTTDALVQLWYRRDSGKLYLGDPDDGQRLYRLDDLPDPDLTAAPLGDPWSGGLRRDFGVEAHGLLCGDVSVADLGAATVGRPDPANADMILAAAYNDAGARLIADPAELDKLSAGGRAYLGTLLPEPQRPVEVIPQRQRQEIQV